MVDSLTHSGSTSTPGKPEKQGQQAAAGGKANKKCNKFKRSAAARYQATQRTRGSVSGCLMRQQREVPRRLSWHTRERMQMSVSRAASGERDMKAQPATRQEGAGRRGVQAEQWQARDAWSARPRRGRCPTAAGRGANARIQAMRSTKRAWRARKGVQMQGVQEPSLRGAPPPHGPPLTESLSFCKAKSGWSAAT